MTDFTAARLNMIESQVRPNGITDRRIIAAMERIPRELFVPESRRAVAYMDEDVPLEPASGQPRALIESMAFARMLQHAAVKPTDKLLIIGAGTGYGAAVTASLAAATVALECDPGLATDARRNLEGTANVKLVEGPLEAGVPAARARAAAGRPTLRGRGKVRLRKVPLQAGVPADAPYDVIVAEGRVEEVPQALIDQLADGGRLVAVVGEADMAQAVVHTRSGTAIAVRQVFDASIAALPGMKKKKPAFVF